jgi:integrase
MSVFRPSYHSPIYEPATYSTKNGKRLVRFRLPKTGKYVTGEVLPSGKARILSPLWYARIRRNGKSVRVPLGVADKESALAIRQQLQLKADQGRAGTIDPMAEHRGTPLSDHLADYRMHQEASGFCPDHIKESQAMIVRICRTCSWQYIEEIGAPPFNQYLAALIRKGRSFRTRNKHLQTMRAFIHWMQKQERMEADPFRNFNLLNAEADPNRRERRALTADELTRLCEAATVGPVVQGITGPERALIYAVAVTSGLRARELGMLKVRDLVLDADIPFIALPSAIAKSRREANLPLHPAVATRLDDFTAASRPNDLVFSLITEEQTGGKGGKMRLTNRMIRSDFKRAGIEGKNAHGHVDFHALRTTFITNTCRLTDQFTAMKLARHTKATITARHYDKVLMSQRANVVAMLPAPGESRV